jgi:hypothetical protein
MQEQFLGSLPGSLRANDEILFTPCGRYMAHTALCDYTNIRLGIIIRDLKTNQAVFYEYKTGAFRIHMVSRSRRDGVERLISGQ